jgi:hypothetical protein
LASSVFGEPAGTLLPPATVLPREAHHFTVVPRAPAEPSVMAAHSWQGGGQHRNAPGALGRLGRGERRLSHFRRSGRDLTGMWKPMARAAPLAAGELLPIPTRGADRHDAVSSGGGVDTVSADRSGAGTASKLGRPCSSGCTAKEGRCHTLGPVAGCGCWGCGNDVPCTATHEAAAAEAVAEFFRVAVADSGVMAPSGKTHAGKRSRAEFEGIRAAVPTPAQGHDRAANLGLGPPTEASVAMGVLAAAECDMTPAVPPMERTGVGDCDVEVAAAGREVCAVHDGSDAHKFDEAGTLQCAAGVATAEPLPPTPLELQVATATGAAARWARVRQYLERRQRRDFSDEGMVKYKQRRVLIERQLRQFSGRFGGKTKRRGRGRRGGL